jgi:hypothetical protein
VAHQLNRVPRPGFTPHRVTEAKMVHVEIYLIGR